MQTLTQALEGTRVHHATKAKMQRLEDALRAEYPGVELEVECEEDSKEYTLIAYARDGEVEVRWDQQTPDMADVLEGLMAQGATEEDLVGEDEEEEEEERGGRSVVRDEYRQEYRLVSTNKQTNGDWLAETITGLLWDRKEGFNIAGFEAMLDLNGVDMSAPWARVLGTKGGAGRFRMNGRQALEKRIALTGRFHTGEGWVELGAGDADFDAFVVDVRSKHARWLEKLAKQEAKKAAAEAAAE